MSGIRIGGLWYKQLPEVVANVRRSNFLCNPDMVAGVDKLAVILGQSYADKYLTKFLDNLRYEQINVSPKKYECPCTYRKQHNPLYECYNVTCKKP